MLTQSRGNGSGRHPDADERLARVEERTELPMLLLSFCMVPLLLGPLLWEMSLTEELVYLVLDTVIWAVFVAEIVIKVAIARDRVGFLRSNWLEVLMAIVPPFRPLRLIRLVLFGSRAIRHSSRLANIDYLGVYAVGLILIGSTIVAAVEIGAEGGQISHYPDALWWALVTVTTVGYGDVTPVTAAGRVVAVFLIVGGVGLFGALTANLASSFIRSSTRRSRGESRAVEELAYEIRELREEVARLRADRGE